MGYVRYSLPHVGAIEDILGPQGAIARRLGQRYEHRPQQIELAQAIEEAVEKKLHLLAEAGTGVGKSFAYLVPIIDWAVRNKKRVVVSTHTISLQEQLIEKDIPLIRAVMPAEFSAVLVKGRSNYLCQRRLEQARGRQGMLFETTDEFQQLRLIEEWAAEQVEKGGEGSLSKMRVMPLPQVWDKVAAEAGNCLGKKCHYFEKCFWQAARRRMTTGNVLVVNHALFFSDLALRISGVNYLPKYDVVVLDEAHTVEEVAGQHFGIKVSEASVKYNLRTLYDLRRGRGVLTAFGPVANDAIATVIDLADLTEDFFGRLIDWQENHGRSNGRVHEPHIIENTLSPKLRELTTRLTGLLTHTEKDEEIAEITALAGKVEMTAGALEALVAQQMPDAVYWIEVAGGHGKTQKRATWHAAPIDVAAGLDRHLFQKMASVIMTSATLCTSGSGGVSPPRKKDESSQIRHSKHLPHLTPKGGIFAVNFRLADSVPQAVAEQWRSERDAIVERAKSQQRDLTPDEEDLLRYYFSERIEELLDKAEGECLMKQPEMAALIETSLKHFDGERYDLIAWCVMPNHVHVVFRPLGGHTVSAITHSWKSFTSHAINQQLGRDGSVWQEESYDRKIRNAEELHAQALYAFENAIRAGMSDWQWCGLNQEALGLAADMLDGVKKDGGEEIGGRDAPPTPARFQYIARRMGVRERVRTLSVGSPFDYESQCTMYVEASLPDPSDKLFAARARERVIHYLQQTRGGAFVLFTAYKPMIDMANSLKTEIEQLGLTLLVHGQGAPRNVLLERFRATPNAVLFGTSSFWQGIDVQGEALRNVIIVKLPFSVPDEPLVEAKLEAITKAGGNAFMEYSVPEAIIRLKQGFGRLIRSRFDKGIVVILDSRVVTKRYGRLFLDSLPKCRIVEVKEEFEGYGDYDDSQVSQWD